METKLVNGKFSQRKRNGSPAIFGILAAIIGVILAINAFRDLSIPQSPQEHVIQFMIPAVILFVAYLLLFSLGRQDNPCDITFENSNGELKLTVTDGKEENFKIESVAKHSFCIRQVVPSPWSFFWSQPWHGFIVRRTYLELTVTTKDGLEMVLCENFRDDGNLDLPMEISNEFYSPNYYSDTQGTLVEVEKMLNEKPQTDPTTATDKYY